MNPPQTTSGKGRGLRRVRSPGGQTTPPPGPLRHYPPEAVPLEVIPGMDAGCPFCSEQLVLMGLPYRIVLRCSHTADS